MSWLEPFGPGDPVSCRGCGAAVYRVEETGVRIAMAGWVDAKPYLGPLARGPPRRLWEAHPRLGWICLDVPARRGYPLHRTHICTSTKKANPS